MTRSTHPTPAPPSGTLAGAFLLMALMLLGFPTPGGEALGQSPEDADKIATELNRKKAAFKEAKSKQTLPFLKAIDEKIDAARKKGDLALLKDLDAARRDFSEKGALPASQAMKEAVEKYRKSLRKSLLELETAYQTAIESYTKASRLARAEAMQKELEAFEKETAVLKGAEDATPEVSGQWPGFKAGRPHSYHLWHDNGRWHLQTTVPFRKNGKFLGSIDVVGGKIESFKSEKLETEGRSEDEVKVNGNQTGISFTLVTKNGEIDAFDFKVSEGAKKVVFTLRRAAGAYPQDIFIGKNGSHPAAATFTLPANPTK